MSGRCSHPIDNKFTWEFYMYNVMRYASDKHMQHSVMLHDAEQTDDPILRRFIEWRMNDPRVIAVQKKDE